MNIQSIKFNNIREFIVRYKNACIFLAGFTFDAVTINRIDALSDLLIQIVYLVGLSFVLIYQYRFHYQLWSPHRYFVKAWDYNVEILHFLYGGLLSAYVILYLKSTSGARAIFFLILLAVLLILNEMPQIKRFGYRLRLGLYCFCVTSFLIYFIPILIGQMGHWIFSLSILLSGIAVWFVAGALVTQEKNKRMAQLKLYAPAGFLLGIIVFLYSYKLIPPVPLSVQYQGVFHDVKRSNGKYTLTYPKPPFYLFWREDSQPFSARKDDEIHFFARIFAPSRFKHQVMIRWSLYNPKKDKFFTTDLVPFNVKGGRAKGFRGYVSKSNYTYGKWRVSIETEDGRVLGQTTFKIKMDPNLDNRKWNEIRM